jgi:hypothetical protein
MRTTAPSKQSPTAPWKPPLQRRKTLQLPNWKLKRLPSRWTRTQRIRTAASIPVDAVIAEGGELPVYLKIAHNAKHLRELGMSDRAIARALGISDKTIAKAAGTAGDLAPAMSKPKEVS